MMADEKLNESVIVQANRIDSTLLPKIFSQPYMLYVIQQGTDLGNVASKANESGEGAFIAQKRNDEQDIVLENHEQRIASNEQTLVNHENRISANEVQLFDHEARITTNEGAIANHEARISNNEIDIVGLQGRMNVAESDIDYLLDVAVDHESRISFLETDLADFKDYMLRQKSEVVYSGISLAITTAQVNLLTLLGTLTPTSGTLAPFFDTDDGLLIGLNKNKNLSFKLSIRGSYDNASGNRSMEFTFGVSVPDTIVYSRDSSVMTDNVFINTFFSVEEGGEIVSPGIPITIKANGSAFTATEIKIIATQQVIMFEIDKVTGSQLMQLWGVDDWPLVDGDYFLWNGVGVFVVRDHASYVELHMAMKKDERKRCREAVTDILNLIGQREVWAQIKAERKHVCNLAKKFSFVETWRGKAKFVGGEVDDVILMKRYV